MSEVKADIDGIALDLTQKIWQIGNRHGPDSQRKAQIQVLLTEFLEGWNRRAPPQPVDAQGGE